jgi:hypothetical protein
MYGAIVKAAGGFAGGVGALYRGITDRDDLVAGVRDIVSGGHAVFDGRLRQGGR